MTSAPKSASRRPQNGAAMVDPSSSTRKGARAPVRSGVDALIDYRSLAAPRILLREPLCPKLKTSSHRQDELAHRLARPDRGERAREVFQRISRAHPGLELSLRIEVEQLRHRAAHRLR